MIDVQLQERERVNRISTINEIREKTKLLNKCQRKMQFSALDPDNMEILAAAREQLSAEINELCWRIGL